MRFKGAKLRGQFFLWDFSVPQQKKRSGGTKLTGRVLLWWFGVAPKEARAAGSKFTGSYFYGVFLFSKSSKGRVCKVKPISRPGFYGVSLKPQSNSFPACLVPLRVTHTSFFAFAILWDVGVFAFESFCFFLRNVALCNGKWGRRKAVLVVGGDRG